MLNSRLVFQGNSSVVSDLNRTIEKFAAIRRPLLVLGAKGTGKRRVARAIHEAATDASGNYAKIDCQALAIDTLKPTIQEAFQKCRQGTVVLVGVHTLTPSLQVELMNCVLGEGHVCRVIFTAEKDLSSDLMGIFGSLTIRMPTLHDRKEDISILIQSFLTQFNAIVGHDVQFPEGQALEALVNYSWPGNVSELEAVMERLVAEKKHGAIELSDLPSSVFAQFAERQPNASGAVAGWEFPRMALPDLGLDLKAVVTAFENHLVDQALSRTGGNKNRASELLKMNRTTLVEKLRKRGMIIPAKNGKNGDIGDIDADMSE